MHAGLTSLKRRHSSLASGDEQVRVLESAPGIPSFESKLQAAGFPTLLASGIDIFQINVGKLCNQTCSHCHVDAGPDRLEIMSRETMELCLAALAKTSIPKVDITGGAPELNPNFRWLVQQVRALGRHVIDRCNLSVLLIQGQAGLIEFLAEQNVEIICSLPYFQERETDRQRGSGVFEKSIQALQMLNQLGYGKEGSTLTLNLVYNPVGAFLPGSQKGIEAEFRRNLGKKYGIEFHHLYCITNMPISRFLEFLLMSGNYERYMQRLVQAFNPAAIEGVMCRNTISIGWDGTLYDCDFNQMLDMPIRPSHGLHISDFRLEKLASRAIATGRHCFGCTAGAGSGCSGSTT